MPQTNRRRKQPAAGHHDRHGEEQPPLQVNTRTLAYLNKVAELSTFTEAADEFGISQPALSQSLSQLEQRLGVDLFEQDGRRRRLTEAGRMVAEFASEVLGRAGELQTWINSHRHGTAGLLRIGLIDAATLYLLPEALTSFRETHPDVEIRLVVDSTDALCDRLLRYELDLAFAVGPAVTGLTAESVGAEGLRIYARDAAADPMQVEWALYPVGSRTRALIDTGLAERDIHPLVTLTSQNPDVLRQVASMGPAWTVLPEAVGGRDPGLTDVAGEAIAYRPLVLLRRDSAPADPRVDALSLLARDAAALTAAATPGR